MPSEVSQAIASRAEDLSILFRSLGHPVRLKILCRLIDGEETVNELTQLCGISQSAMSQFLGRMKDEGLLESRKQKNSVFYQIRDSNLKKLLIAMKKIYC